MALPKHVVAPLPQEMLDRGLLLDIIGRIDQDGANNGGSANEVRWLNGITWTPEPNYALFTNDVDVCTRIDYAVTPRVCDVALTQTAFSVYDAFKGSAIEFAPDDIEEVLKGRITRKLSAAFATELISGAISGDRSLANTAHAPFLRAFASAATPIWYALTVLEDDLARTLRNGEGIIHMPPGMLAQAKVTYGLMLDESGQWETPLGHRVVADAGYVDTLAPTGQSASAASTEWVYASGPVRYGLSGPHMVDGGNIGSTITNFTSTETAAQSMFKSRDDIIRYVDAFGIFQFDTAPVTAVLASYEATDIV